MTRTLTQVRECKFYTDRRDHRDPAAGPAAPALTAVAVQKDGRFETMRTLAPPVGRGYEYLNGSGWDFQTELEQIPALLAEKLAAPSVRRAGTTWQ